MGNRTYNTSRRSVCMSDDTYEAICAAANEKRMSPAALIRRYIEDGLKIGIEIAHEIKDKIDSCVQGYQISAPFGKVDLALNVVK